MSTLQDLKVIDAPASTRARILHLERNAVTETLRNGRGAA
jgi:hypothetical protein